MTLEEVGSISVTGIRLNRSLCALTLKPAHFRTEDSIKIHEYCLLVHKVK